MAYGAFEVITTRRFKAILWPRSAASWHCCYRHRPAAVLRGRAADDGVRSATSSTKRSRCRSERRRWSGAPACRRWPWYGGQPEHDNHTPDWEPTNLRTGALVVALALAALVLAPRRRETWFFFGMAVICGWIGLNAWPLAGWLHRVPLFNITINDRLALAAAFALAMLAAIAADHWPASRAPQVRRGGDRVRRVHRHRVTTANVFDSRIALGVKPGLITTLSSPRSCRWPSPR